MDLEAFWKQAELPASKALLHPHDPDVKTARYRYRH